MRLTLDLTGAGSQALTIDDDGDGFADRTVDGVASVIPEAPLQLLGVRQVESLGPHYHYLYDPATYGLIIGALFNRPVDHDSAVDLTHYGIGNNRVLQAHVLRSGRLVYLYLAKPIGQLVARQLSVHDVLDVTGQTVTPSTMPITAIYGDGARVLGQVREASGKPVPNAVIRVTSGLTLASMRTDSTGSYDIDFVRKLDLPRFDFHVQAQHPKTLKHVVVTGTIRGPGQTILIHPTFFGLGTVRGRVFAPDGVTPMAGMGVQLTSGFTNPLAALTNAAGEYVFTDVPVGTYSVTTRIKGRGMGAAQGLIPTADAESITDIVFANTEREQLGALVGRAFLSDGRTPAAGFRVYFGHMIAANPASRTPAGVRAIEQMTADDNGSFSFSDLPVGEFDVVAYDPATQQLGSAKAVVLANVTNAVVVVLQAFGSIEGLVLDAQGRPKAGALVAGGLELVTTDANGFFHVDNIPAGHRTLDAGDPVTRRRGSAMVDVLPGQTVPIVIKLEARATIAGRVFDAAGNPVGNVSVRIPQDDGYIFVFADANGFYKFPDMELGDYLSRGTGSAKACAHRVHGDQRDQPGQRVHDGRCAARPSGHARGTGP